MSPAERAPLGERLEAAAISLKMIAAKKRGVAPWFTTIASRFEVEEPALRRAFRSRATQQSYDRIHSNDRPGVDL